MPSLALYIHWPFCRKKCPYCDFNSHVRAEVEELRWEKALLAELRYFAARTPGRKLASIFFGGGTPSLMPPTLTAALIEEAKALWPTDEDIEITLEANPTSSEAEKFRAFRDAGVNRISMGIQSLRENELSFLGREHSAPEALRALGWAKEIFPRYSFDLIYAQPSHTLENWQMQLEEAFTHAGKHLSLYQLTIEPETPFERFYKAGNFALPDEETAAQLYELTETICAHHGLFPYEVSNYAAPGEASQHNLTYWRGGEYVGIGPGAHGRIQNDAGDWLTTATLKSPERWLTSVENKDNGVEHEVLITPRERFEECVMTGLRLTEGFSLSHLKTITRYEAPDTFHLSTKALSEQGLIMVKNDHITIAPRGRLLVNAVAERLLA